jgi:hypothetical protein
MEYLDPQTVQRVPNKTIIVEQPTLSPFRK